MELMIELSTHFSIFIYKKDPKSTWDGGIRLKNYSEEISKESIALYLCSPNLQRILSYDYKRKLLCIKCTLEPNMKSIELPIANISDDLQYHIDFVSRFRWVSENKFLIASPWGYEKLYEIIDDANLIEIGAGQIPCFSDLSVASQIYFEQESLEIGNLKKRLIRKHQALKRLRSVIGDQDVTKIYETLFSIDYNVEGGKGKFVSDTSFSLFQWNLLDEIKLNQRQAQDLDNSILTELCLNILPGCQTLLHVLQEKPQQLLEIISRISICSDTFEMPFIKDLEGKTPLHYCVENKISTTAELLVEYLSQAPLDHHSRDIIDIIPNLISMQIPSIVKYFDARILQTEQMAQLNRGCIIHSESVDWGMVPSSIWDNSNNIQQKIFVEQGQLKRGQFETEVDLNILDLPHLHQLSHRDCNEFFKALKDIKEESVEFQLFELKSIRMLIEYHWPLTKKFTIKKLWWFFLYLLLFWIYTNFTDTLLVYEDTLSTVIWIMNLVALFLLSGYFLLNECRQISSVGASSYFKDPWNYIDFPPPLIVITIAIVSFAGIDSWEAPFKSVGSLFMWLKLLYFLRLYDSTGYLIRMIVKVIFRMKTFLLLLLITITAVADAFISIQVDDAQEYNGFFGFVWHRIKIFFAAVTQTYFLILGGDQFTVGDGFEIFATFLTIFSTLFVMIVMLNLLISIVGEIYGKVQENMINESYQEKATIISENQYLIPQEELDKISKEPNQLLLIATTKGFKMNATEVEERQDQLLQRIKKIEEILERKLPNEEMKKPVKMQMSRRTGLRSQNTSFQRSTILERQ
ncbi:hypothetical protein FGO68_gene14100 [Halteria grandinella]|uniref:Ion transport domain-containing protein n=1 Tax=Halteria grandinella TaxID=5974 RepID=A0A8J8TAA2_HALGN|nr:hypothetical protein FGO68_gene14100 [Halteria grandinella]